MHNLWFSRNFGDVDFLTKLGTFGKIEHNFVTLGNFNNDHDRNFKIDM